MNKMTKMLSAFYADQNGATAIEYGLIAGLISIAVIGSALVVSNNLSGVFNFITAAADNAL